MNEKTIYYSHPFRGGRPFARGFDTRLEAVKFTEEQAFPDSGDGMLIIYTEEEFEKWCSDNDVDSERDNKALTESVEKVRSVFADGHEKALEVSNHGITTAVPYTLEAYEDAVIDKANEGEFVELINRSAYECYNDNGKVPQHGGYRGRDKIKAIAKEFGWEEDILKQNFERLEEYRRNGGWLWATQFSAKCDSPAFVVFRTGPTIPEGNEGATLLFDGPTDWGECFSDGCRDEFLDAIKAITPGASDGFPHEAPKMELVDAFTDHLPTG